SQLSVKLRDDSVEDVDSVFTYYKDNSSLASELNVRDLNMDDQKSSRYEDDSKMSIQANVGVVSDTSKANSKGKSIETDDPMIIFSKLNDDSSSSQKSQNKDPSPLRFGIADKDKNDCFSSSASSSSSSLSGVVVQQGQSSNTYIEDRTDRKDRRIRPIRKVRTR